LKPISIALSWSLLLIALLKIDTNSLLSISIFLQILSLSIIYDDKDYEQDKLYQLKTLRTEFGYLKMTTISGLIYILSIFLFHQKTAYYFIETFLFILIIMTVKRSKNPWNFILVLDSLIFIRPLLYLIQKL
jgi:4-hydroxybenzoate polyprenyltransferase